jgi:hypothetical protein
MQHWSIRCALPDGAQGQDALKSALAQFQHEVVTDGRGADVADVNGDVVVAIGGQGILGDLLRALHEISPQVLVTRVAPSGPAAAIGR